MNKVRYAALLMTLMATAHSLMGLAPTISDFTPKIGNVGSTITLSGLYLGTVSGVLVGESEASFTVDSINQLTITIPEGGGSVPIEVTNPDGSTLSIDNFTYPATSPPTIDFLSPEVGSPGTMVTISGYDFNGTTNVWLNDLPITFESFTDDTIEFWVPDGASTGYVKVQNYAGSTTSTDTFTVINPPWIIDFTPLIGLQGDVITINGAYFSGTTSVTIDGTEASFTVLSPTVLSVTVPAGGGAVFLEVTNADGTDEAEELFTYAATNPPTIDEISPLSGIPNDYVTITGYDFNGTVGVQVNGLAATFQSFTDDLIEFWVPMGATTGLITVENRAGSTVSSDTYTVLPIPEISDFSPLIGLAGDTITITGNHLSDVFSVRIDGAEASFTIINDTTITATVPPGGGSVRLDVTTPATGVEAFNAFTYAATNSPTIDGISPLSGNPGDKVTITGYDFNGTVNVLLNGLAASFESLTDDTIDFWVPTGATTGLVTVENMTGTTVSSDTFTIFLIPEISDFSPSVGLAGDTITITGNHLSDVTSVRIDGAEASFSVINATTITATVPPGGGSVLLDVTSPATTVAAANAFTYAATNSPTIDGISPLSGNPGDKVTITGYDFNGTVNVLLNGLAATFESLTDDTIDFWVPTGATTGLVTVENMTGTTVSSDTFTVIPVQDPNAGKSYVTIGDQTWFGNGAIYSAPSEGVAGILVNGGLAMEEDSNWSGKVVLVERGSIDFGIKVKNVQQSGGIAVVLYNSTEGDITPDLRFGNASTIPAIMVTQADGQAILANNLGQSATVINRPNNPQSTETLAYVVENGEIVIVESLCGVDPELIIPDSIDGMPVTIIGLGAFSLCDSLTSVTIPDSVKIIAPGAFSDCPNLVSVTLGNSLTTIDQGAFIGCTKLETIEIPASVTHIGEGVFAECTSLVTIEIPASVTFIGQAAFGKCLSLTSIWFNGPVPTFGEGLSLFVQANQDLVIHYPLGTPGWEATFVDRPKTQFWGAFRELDIQSPNAIYVDTGSWLGQVEVSSVPYVYSFSMGSWLYIPSSSAEEGVGWVWTINP